MTGREEQTLETFKEGIAKGWKFLYLGAGRNAIRAYNKHDVTIMTVDLNEMSADAEAEVFDLLTPYL